MGQRAGKGRRRWIDGGRDTHDRNMDRGRKRGKRKRERERREEKERRGERGRRRDQTTEMHVTGCEYLFVVDPLEDPLEHLVILRKETCG